MLGRRSDGKPNRRTKTFDKKGDAVIWANQQVAKYYGGSTPSQQLADILFEDVAVNCFRDLHERMLLATRTEELYLSNYRLHILPLLKGRAVGSVDGRLLTECLDRIKFENPGRPLTRTVTIAKTVLQYIFDYAYKQHFLTDNPMLYVTLPQQTVSEKERRYQEVDQRQISKELEATLLSASSDDSSELMRVAIPLLLDSGLRIGEAVSIRWSDISFEDKLISVRQAQFYESEIDLNTLTVTGRKTVFGHTKTPTSVRSIPLADFLSEKLGTWREYLLNAGCPQKQLQGDGFVLCTKSFQGFTISGFRSNFRHFLKRHNLEGCGVVPHSFRHAYITDMFAAGNSLMEVERVVGHSRVSTTEGYLPKRPEVDFKAFSEKQKQYHKSREKE